VTRRAGRGRVAVTRRTRAALALALTGLLRALGTRRGAGTDAERVVADARRLRAGLRRRRTRRDGRVRGCGTTLAVGGRGRRTLLRTGTRGTALTATLTVLATTLTLLAAALALVATAVGRTVPAGAGDAAGTRTVATGTRAVAAGTLALRGRALVRRPGRRRRGGGRRGLVLALAAA
ncbi:hypothetical protein, partial [Actinomycetospora succinea]|uniref:hypothetical protein n=1 Tax=Actinomycetospora succinea TaxID=663603 RepID=UPI0031F0F384